MASELEQKIIRQVEYYFGDMSLPRDKFLQEKIKEDDGWVTLDVLLTFKRLAALSEDPEVIVTALEKSKNKIVDISECRKKVRRNPEKPIPEFDDERKKEITSRTVYAKGFPLDEELGNILNFLETFGEIERCSRRTTQDHQFKGSCFIIFKDIEAGKKFIEEKDLKYKDTELIRKWKKDYFADKKKHYEEIKKEKKEVKLENVKKVPEYPKGAVIHFSGIEEGQELTREELKEKINEISDIEISFIDFKRGDKEGYIRFTEKDTAAEFFKKVPDGVLEVNDSKLTVRVLEGEEEDEYLKKTAESVLEIRRRNKQNSKNNRKRKGNFGKQGREQNNAKRGKKEAEATENTN